jgi:hypothetical protein
MRHRGDNRLHWSDLREIAKSPAHYRYAVEHPKDTTRAMRVGAGLDALIFRQKRVICYPGAQRRGKEWEHFERLNRDAIILIESEHGEAMGAAQAVLDDPVARPLLQGGTQVVSQWEYLGVPCAAGVEGERGGFDVLNHQYIADVKGTSCTEPGEFSRHAWNMMYPQQLEFYKNSNDVIKRGIKRSILIGVEMAPPHVVTVLEIPEQLQEIAAKSVHMLVEKYKACEESGQWPGYVQQPVELTLPAWMQGEDE